MGRILRNSRREAAREPEQLSAEQCARILFLYDKSWKAKAAFDGCQKPGSRDSRTRIISGRACHICFESLEYGVVRILDNFQPTVVCLIIEDVKEKLKWEQCLGEKRLATISQIQFPL